MKVAIELLKGELESYRFMRIKNYKREILPNYVAGIEQAIRVLEAAGKVDKKACIWAVTDRILQPKAKKQVLDLLEALPESKDA